jgi:uncharacterized membrane protein YbhN (UPF0104 family)
MRAEERDLVLELEEDDATYEQETQQIGDFQESLQDRRKVLGFLALFVLLVVAIYVVFPALVGLDEAVHKLDDAVWYWIVVAIGFNVAAFGAYVALFRGVLSGSTDDDVHRRLDLRASYQITMAGLAATRIFSAAGAGGIVLTYWALRKAGMPRRRAACRMVAFLVLTAALAGCAMAIFLLIALIPDDVERRMQRFAGGYRRTRYLTRLAKGPATLASGVRTAMAFVRDPRGGALAVGGAVGFWAANIGVLWASFEAFGGDVPFGVLVQGFFVGMAANLIPSPAGGVGSVDAGMIAAFVLFGIDESTVFPAVLTYRVIAFWLPIPPGILAFFQLRKTVASWERERQEGVAAGHYTSKSKVMSR